MTDRILVQKNEKVMACLQETLIIAGGKPHIFFEQHQIDRRVGMADQADRIIYSAPLNVRMITLTRGRARFFGGFEAILNHCSLSNFKRDGLSSINNSAMNIGSIFFDHIGRIYWRRLG